MSKLIRISDEVYDALQILKVHPSTSFSDIIKGIIDQAFPGDFFDTDDIDRILFQEQTGLVDCSPGELRQIMREKRRRNDKYENPDLDK
jgi:hypothetical protein